MQLLLAKELKSPAESEKESERELGKKLSSRCVMMSLLGATFDATVELARG